jgi:hypothetical protein
MSLKEIYSDHTKFDLLPIKCDKEREAMNQASFLSKSSMFFYHVIWNNSGGYVIDVTGIVGHDDKLIATYHNGERV